MIDFRLYLVTDRRVLKAGSLESAVHDACKAGVGAIQLREKDLDAKSLHHLAVGLRRITAESHTALFVNDRVDVAMAVDADGVHCPESGFTPAAARRVIGMRRPKDESFPPRVRPTDGEHALIGASTHSVEAAIHAEKDGADFITFGPVFETASKLHYGEPQGLEKLREVSSSVRIPVFAIGGVTSERAKVCVAEGAWGVAVVSSIFASTDIGRAVREFDRALGGL
jgi:thiamine-phosphate pyrophosphorylase